MAQQIDNYDNNRNWDGYNQWVDIDSDMLWMRGVYKHGTAVGYHEVNIFVGGIGEEGTQVEFHIK